MTGWTGLWILLPIVGWFVWTVKTQGCSLLLLGEQGRVELKAAAEATSDQRS